MIASDRPDPPEPEAECEPDGSEQFEPFYRRKFPTLVAVLRMNGYRQDDALDAATTAMVQLWLRWADVNHPWAWVRKAARHEAAAAADQRLKEFQRGVRGWQPPHDDQARIADIDDKDPLMAMLAILPTQQRHSFVLVAMEGHTVEDVAAELRISPATVRSHIRHARDRLKQWLQDSGDWRCDEAG